MIVQAAKIIGSGLATIGLLDTLLSVIKNNKNLISEIVYTDLAKKAIHTVSEMINSLDKDSLLYEFLHKEIPESALITNGKLMKGDLIVDNYDILKKITYKKGNVFKNINSSFFIAGVYIFIGQNNEQYIGSSINLYTRLRKHKSRFKDKRRVSKLYVSKYKYDEYK
jgi:GIY-YIG catalytic domain